MMRKYTPKSGKNYMIEGHLYYYEEEFMKERTPQERKYEKIHCYLRFDDHYSQPILNIHEYYSRFGDDKFYIDKIYKDHHKFVILVCVGNHGLSSQFYEFWPIGEKELVRHY